MAIHTKTQPPVVPAPVNTDLTSAIGSITAMIVQALEAPLRMQVEACIQNIVNEATKDIHARIAAAVGQIQPIQIPINLFTQPIIQMPTGVADAATFGAVMPVAEDSVEEIEELEQEEEPEEKEEEKKAEASPPAPAKLPVIRRPASTLNTPAPALKKPLCITIVGLLPGQSRFIRDEFKFIKFQFISSDSKGVKKLSALAKTNDYVIQMVKFISHSTGDSVKAANGNWNQIPLSGGMSMLRNKVSDLYAQYKQTI